MKPFDSSPASSAAAGTNRLRTAITEAASTLFPGYFALVMATAAMSVACYRLGYSGGARTLLWFNWIFYATLWGLTLIRLVRFPRQVIKDLFDHQRAPGFFTIVAGTCVLSAQTMIVGHAHGVALILWWTGLGLWFLVMYAFFTAVTVRQNKPSLATGINGAWLIAAVATQSIVVARGAVDGLAAPAEWLQFLCLTMFMIGCMLYLAIIPLIFYRLTFIRMTSRDFSPSYWINMGAVAITTLAGSTLILRAGHWPLIDLIAPFLPGFTLFFWAAATWWIPFLIALTDWRYLIRHDRVAYEPQLWGMVFPLAMYTTATFHLSQALQLNFLTVISQVFIFVAAAAWIVAFAGLLMHAWRGLRPAEAAPSPR
ncbi:MAG TPA: tellurite resistance/C4-dicarboxylate transporter family protein [Sphingomicrobium sp.]|nr:tellurite resistance/C4-dicarboxylate transporter family protein [Sphingomicrobium sp.]